MPHGPPTDHFILQLYVTGSAVHSLRAVQNLRRLCADHLAGHHEVEIIDIYLRPGAALGAQILVAPTLIRLHPPPVRRISGDLSDTVAVLSALGIPPPTPGEP